MIVPLIVICVCDDELYTLYENLHYHLNDFVTQIWLEAVTLILSFVFFIEALLEPLTYLKEYNCHGFCLNYILGCDIQVYHSIVSTPSMYYEQDFG